MIKQINITLPPFKKGFHLITSIIEDQLGDLPEKGLLNIFIKHTSAALTINENVDSTVRTDLNTIFDKIVPENDPSLRHTMEGADDMPAHAKSTLAGPSLTMPITNHRLNLGTWQGIYLCEFRNYGGSRKLLITIYS